jgi:hypothetical protein
LDSLSLNPASCPTSVAPDDKTAQILSIFKKHGILQGAAEAVASNALTSWFNEGLPSVGEMKKWVGNAETDNVFASCLASDIACRDTQVTELLSDCLLESKMEWNPPTRLDPSPSLTKRFASISDTSNAYTLNEEQHFALKAVGKALLSRWKEAEVSDCSGPDLMAKLRKGQLLMFLGGEGGTGKSRIIDAVQALCISWGRPDCICKTALTGKAATLIGGRTLASFILQIRKQRSTETTLNLELPSYPA